MDYLKLIIFLNLLLIAWEDLKCFSISRYKLLANFLIASIIAMRDGNGPAALFVAWRLPILCIILIIIITWLERRSGRLIIGAGDLLIIASISPSYYFIALLEVVFYTFTFASITGIILYLCKNVIWKKEMERCQAHLHAFPLTPFFIPSILLIRIFY